MRLSQFCKNELQAQYSFTYQANTQLTNTCNKKKKKKKKQYLVNTVASDMTKIMTNWF